MAEIVNGNPQNAPSSPVPRSHSNFPLTRRILGTQRFADISPCFMEDIVPKDKDFNLNPKHDLRSYTLKSPLMQDIKMHRTYGFVANQAILPFNWDKIQNNPPFGDDVDASAVGCSVAGFSSKVRNMCKAYFDFVLTKYEDVDYSSKGFLNHLIKALLFSEQFLSNGSLFSVLHCKLSKILLVDSTKDFDTFFDEMISKIFNSYYSSTSRFYIDTLIISSNKVYRLYLADRPPFVQENFNIQVLTNLHDLLDVLRDNLGDFEIDFSDDYDKTEIAFDEYTFDWARVDDEIPVDLRFFWAYQIFCAHYFTNDHIDSICNAELFRQYISSLLNVLFDGQATFVYNGVTTQYDFLSAFYFNFCVSYFINESLETMPASLFAYFTALCRFNKSLRYEDYFAGARKFPLGVGDTDVNVVNDKVDILDISKKSMWTRFLQATNRFGRRSKEYLKGLFGADVPHDWHDPLWLCNINDQVYSPEVENTGAAQISQKNSITSVFRSVDSNHAFKFSSELFGILIGVSYFDVERVYSDGIDPMFNHVDRFDFFNPFMQFIGDQPIKVSEINSLGDALPFAYTNRYMEYKQHFGYCFGGFQNDYIDGFAFHFGSDKLWENISSDFIRNHNAELDKFYTSLTGLSLGHYFHFIIKYDNELNGSRDMVYAPSVKL